MRTRLITLFLLLPLLAFGQVMRPLDNPKLVGTGDFNSLTNKPVVLGHLGGQPLNSTLSAFSAGGTPAADKFFYFTSPTAAAQATLTSFGRSLIDDANAAAALTTLGAQPAGLYIPYTLTNSGFASNEVTITQGGAGQNTLALRNPNALGYSAITFGNNAASNSERLAMGYSNGDGFNYIESNNPAGAPPTFKLFFTGTSLSGNRMVMPAAGNTQFFTQARQDSPSLEIGTDGQLYITPATGFGVNLRVLDGVFSSYRALTPAGNEIMGIGGFPGSGNTYIRYYGTWQIINGTNTSTWDQNGNLVIAGGLKVGGSAGVNVSRLRHGTATLVSGSVTVTDANVTTSSEIYPASAANAVTGALRISAQSTGSFTISSSAADNGAVRYLIIEP